MRRMTEALRVLMVSSEVASLAKTGGLGDAVEALANALANQRADANLEVDLIVVTPKYGVTRVPNDAVAWSAPIDAPLGPRRRKVGVLGASIGGAGVRSRVCLLTDADLFDRDGVYGDRNGPFIDNALRFATLSSAALRVAERLWDGALPHILHAHDWHAALSLIYARCGQGSRGPANPDWR